MKWQSHLQIAEWVGSELNFSKQNLLEFAEGSIAPDKWRDHSFHRNQEYLDSRVNEKIVRARRLFLSQDIRYFFEIGVALHYIVDRLIPATSYLEHLNVEEEIERISKSRKESKSKRHPRRKYLEEMRKEIEELEIGDKEKTFLFDPSWTKGKRNTLILALTNLPPHTSVELLFHIAFRISMGVTVSIISDDPPPQLLYEKFRVANESIARIIHRFKYYSISVISLPLLLLVYGKIGIVVYFFALLLNLQILIPLILISRRSNKLKEYLILHERAKTLFIFWLMCSLVNFIAIFYNSKLLLAGVVLFLVAFLHLWVPKIMIDRELADEINWYDWD